jgi:adenylate kinase family enzyme
MEKDVIYTFVMRRVLVVGCCGSGKTSFAQALATRTGLRAIELDALHHGPNWAPRPEFAHDVDVATRSDAWIVDGNYSAVRELLWSRADTVVWLDLPLWLVEWRVVRRSLTRWLRREELWNGNREPGPLGWTDPEHPIRWAWQKHAEYRTRYAGRFADPEFAHLQRIRLQRPQAVRSFLNQLSKKSRNLVSPSIS